jgi:acyl-CoA dehydrogenase
VDLLTPVLKGWCTELGVDIASLGVQVHGGMGFIEEMRAVEDRLGGSDNADLPAIRESLAGGIHALEQATEWVLQTIRRDPNAALAASVNYMMLTGYVCGGWQMARAALAARARLGSGADEGFCRTKIATARFYAEQILPKASALLPIVRSGASTAFALDEEQF